MYFNLFDKLTSRSIYHNVRKMVKSQRLTEGSSEPNPTSKIKLFAKIVNGFSPSTVFIKSSILDVGQGFEYVPQTYLQLILVADTSSLCSSEFDTR